MAQFRIDAPAFSLNSKYECGTEIEYRYKDGTHSPDNCDVRKTGYTGGPASTARHVTTFDLTELPEGATITGAMVCATAGIPKYGAEVSTINGVGVGFGGEKSVPVTIDDGAASVSVNFAYQCVATSHIHSFDGTPQTGHYWDGDTEVYIFETEHESVLMYSDVYLLIEYTPAFTPPELLPYTDPRPVAGETYAKAVHMTELHTNANRVRLARGLGVYDFTRIASLTTYLSGWNAHVLEIREALDETGIPHEAWLPLGVNVPRLDVLLQLRRAVRAVAGIPDDGGTTAVELIVDAEGNGTITGVVWSVDDAGAATMTGATLYVGTNGAATIGTIAVGMTVDAEGNATITGAALPVDDAGAATMTGVALNVETDGAATIG